MGPGSLLALEEEEKSKLAAPAPTAPAAEGLLPVPMSPIERIMERDGKGKTMAKMLIGGLTGMTPFLMPELIGSKARYAQELKDYAAQQTLLNTQNMASQYQGMLFDDDPTNDIEALQMGAIHQPDIYEPVLRDRLQQQINPTQETMFAPDFQQNPETGEWEMIQTGNQGTTTRTGMGAGFIPESRMWSPDAREAAIGEADGHVQQATQNIEELGGLAQQMDEIGEDNWTAGFAGKLEEGWKDFTGAEDLRTLARTKYTQIKNRLAVQGLPPGVASDKDIAMVMEGYLPSTADFTTLRTYIGAMERAEKKVREYRQFESNWLTEKGTRAGMANAWEEKRNKMSGDPDSIFYEPDKQTPIPEGEIDMTGVPEDEKEEYKAWVEKRRAAQ